MELRDDLVGNLSSKGILAYVAVSKAWATMATTAALAALVRCQTAQMREGLQELSTEAPEAVRNGGKGKWLCGPAEESSVQILDDNTTRYRDFVADLKRYWDFLNPTTPFSIGGADGSAIRQFLRDHQNWTPEEWRRALQNRARSVKLFGNGSRTEDFYRWVRRLGDYAAGPLNAYNRPVEGLGNGKAVAIEQGNRAAVERFLAGSGTGSGT